ncbi:MAG: alpha/beta fold hydrolase [Bacillota bacterium]
MTIKGAEPFYLEGNKIGCLLIHGLSSSPSEMRPLGEFLNGMGYTVAAPLLPGHGTQPEDLLKYTWRDWYYEIERTFTELKMHCSQIYLMGLSLGGLLALFGAINGMAISGVVPMAVPIYLGHRMAYAAPLLKYFLKYRNKEERPDAPKQSSQRVAYDVQCIHSVHELLKLRSMVIKGLPKVNTKVMVAHSKDDWIALPSSALFIHKRLGSSPKILKWLSHSGHIITMGPEKEELFTQIDYFITNTR